MDEIERMLMGLGVSGPFEGETRIQDGATYLRAPRFDSEVPEGIRALQLAGDLYFISNSAAHGFYRQFPLVSEFVPDITGIRFGGKKVTIVRDHAKMNNSLFMTTVRDQLKTGSIEGDVDKLFREHIGPRGGHPAGFIEMVHPVYEADNPNAGKLVGRVYTAGKLGSRLALPDYIAAIK